MLCLGPNLYNYATLLFMNGTLFDYFACKHAVVVQYKSMSCFVFVFDPGPV